MTKKRYEDLISDQQEKKMKTEQQSSESAERISRISQRIKERRESHACLVTQLQTQLSEDGERKRVAEANQSRLRHFQQAFTVIAE